jgi:hypothetical protein
MLTPVPAIPWYDKSLTRRVPAGGAVGLDGRMRHGGCFEPFFVPRAEMPQINEEDYVSLLVHLAMLGAEVKVDIRDPDTLIFHQHVEGSCIPPLHSALLDKPILISQEGYVLDGNHRAAAHKHYGSHPVCIVVNRDFHASMEMLFKFPKTYTYGKAA